MKTYNDPLVTYNQTNVTYNGAVLYSELFSETIAIAGSNYMTELIIDSYTEDHQDSELASWESGNLYRGQSFYNEFISILTSATFYIKKSGLPTGLLYAEIFAKSGSSPVGSALAISDAFDLSTLTTSFALINFSFTGDQKIQLSAGTNYFVVLHCVGGDTSNSLRIGADTSGSATGIWTYSSDGINWLTSATYDVIFYVYGEESSAFLFTKSIIRNVVETITNTDLLAKLFARITTSTIANTELLIKSTVKNISEVVTVVDTKSFSIVKNILETINNTEIYIKSLLRAFSEIIANSEFFEARKNLANYIIGVITSLNFRGKIEKDSIKSKIDDINFKGKIK